MHPTKARIYKLKFTSPLHINKSKGSDDYSRSDKFIHSDTLKSALFSKALLLDPELHFVEKGYDFFKSFIVSSTFPYYKNILFLPKPKGILPFKEHAQTQSSFDFHKNLRKISFIEWHLFVDAFCNSTNVATDIEVQLIKSWKCIVRADNKFTIHNSDYEKEIILTSTQERVYIKNYEVSAISNSQRTDPYIVERIFFREEAGLYFILKAEQGFDYAFFEKTLRTLGDYGIGTDRNVGNGQFEVIEFFDIDLPYLDKATYCTNLSLFIPKREEIDLFGETCQYKLLQRGGWISNVIDLEYMDKHVLKKSVFMIEEGSLLMNNQFVGKIVDLRPDTFSHPVWRDGRSVFLPINNIKI